MGTGIRTKYNIAINGRGYILRGTPDRPAYSRSVVATEIERLAISDLAYSDFSGSGLFYLAQTDWNSGIKTEKLWRDDGKYYYSTNIDTYSEQGVIKLEKELQDNHDFTREIICAGSFPDIPGYQLINAEYIGTDATSAQYPFIYRRNGVSAWTQTTTSAFTSAKVAVSHIKSHKGSLYAGVVGAYKAATSGAFAVAKGPTWTDKAGAISAAVSGVIENCRVIEELGSTLYLGVDYPQQNKFYLVSTSDNGVTFNLEVSLSEGVIITVKSFLSKIYYLVHQGGSIILRAFDPSDSSDIEVATFKNTSLDSSVIIEGGSSRYGESYGLGNLLQEFKNKLIITIPSSEVYEFDGSSLSRIFNIDETKDNIGREASSDLSVGCIEHDSRLIWGNLIYDGEIFYNHKKPQGDSVSGYLQPVVVDASNNIFYREELDKSQLVYNASTYKSTIASNFLVFSEMSPVSKIDKLLFSCTLLFEKLQTGEQIQLQYSIDNMSTWTTLDTLTPASEGSATSKEMFVSTNVIFNKIWWKVLLDGSSTTPKVNDLIMAYKPIPDYKNRWTVQLKMSENFKLLDGEFEERDASDLLSEVWFDKSAKEKILFEDVDYVECSLVSAMTSGASSALVNSTRLFPRQGRIRAISAGVAEEMSYTSAESNKILGISRALRGTRAIAYPSGQTLKNDYDVYIDNVRTSLNFTDDHKSEGFAQVTLIEL